MQNKRSPFLGSVRSVIRMKHLDYQTEKNYIGWIGRFIKFHGSRHPAQMDSSEIHDFLSHLPDRDGVVEGFSKHEQELRGSRFLISEPQKPEPPILLVTCIS